MDLEKLVELAGQSSLPFIYSGEKLNDEKCQKVLKKIGAGTDVLAVISGSALVGLEGIAILKSGIKFSLSSGSTGETMKIPKTKGEYSFNDFIINNVTVKKPFLPCFEVSMVLWDNNKKKSFTFQFKLTQDDLEIEEPMVEELKNILKCLISETGTEYVEPSNEDASGSVNTENKNPNEYHFVYGKIHTIITLNDDNIVIRKLKIDEKTKIQTPKGDPVTISRSAIDSVKLKRAFSPVPLLAGMGIGAGIGFVFFGTVFVFMLGTIIGAILSFPKTMFIFRKDGTKYKTVVRWGEDEYERLINVLFK